MMMMMMMISPKPLLIMLLPILITLLLPHAASHSSGKLVVLSSTTVVNHRNSERAVIETTKGDDNSSIILAEKRTRRKDPNDDFKYYSRGWNISDSHYLFSVSSTALPLFAIAVIWFFGFGGCLLLICCCYCCCRRTPYGYSRIAYALSLIFLSLFTVSAIVGCVVLYTGQAKFHESITDTLDYVVSQSDDTVENLNNVSSILSVAKGIEIDQVSLPSNIKYDISRVDLMISDAATSLEFETHENEEGIQTALNDVRLSLIIIAAVMLLVALLGFLFSILGLQFCVCLLVILGWILVTATLILCGIFLALHNIVGDTCVAMDEWVVNPTAHTALDDILPCFDSETAQETISQTEDVTFQLVEMVNNIIVNISNKNPPPTQFSSSVSYNQSGPLVPKLCNPLNADKTERKCEAGELDFNNATTVWKNYVCQVNENDTCTSVGRLTPKMYNQMTTAVTVSDGLNKYNPFLTGLLDCEFVRETFIGINSDHCPDLTKFSRWVYIGLGLVSAAVMLSLVLWVLYARERKHRKYTKLVNESTRILVTPQV